MGTWFVSSVNRRRFCSGKVFVSIFRKLHDMFGMHSGTPEYPYGNLAKELAMAKTTLASAALASATIPPVEEPVVEFSIEDRLSVKSINNMDFLVMYDPPTPHYGEQYSFLNIATIISIADDGENSCDINYGEHISTIECSAKKVWDLLEKHYATKALENSIFHNEAKSEKE